MTVENALYLLLAYFSGSLPFAYWLGRWFLGVDIRDGGDGNPGASNMFRAGSFPLGVAALTLDYAKGFIPVLTLRTVLGPDNLILTLMAIGPVLGHAFSPFLGFRGGKAVAVTFGIWSGLTLGVVPVILGAALVINTFVFRFSKDGWSVMGGMAAIFLPLLFMDAPVSYWLVWVLNCALLAYTHRQDLREPLSVAWPW